MNDDPIDLARQGGDRPPQGWHDDPHNPGWMRYWNGVAWTEQWRPAPERAPASPQGGSAAGNSTLVSAGWVCAIFVPIVGFVMGIILAARNEPQGIWIILTSMIFGFLFWVALGYIHY